MGSNQSSHANSATNESDKEENQQTLFSVRGRVPQNKNQDEQAAREEKTVEDETPVIVSRAAILSEDEVEENPSLVEAESSEEESEDDSDDSDFEEEDDEDEEDEELAERLRVLAEARALKNLANAFLHPEAPVQVSPESFGRNYFNRASAPETEDINDVQERDQALADAAALKRLAVDYMHPEVAAETTDATATARCYFDRASAPEQESIDDAEERAQILRDAMELRKAAFDYLHPEVGVSSSAPELFGRNYFNRASAPETEEDEYADERAEVLAEAAALKELAVDYSHPEIGVSSSAPELFGRNYYNRASAPETEDVDVAEERAQVLAEAAALKKLAVDYTHPEVGVSSASPELFGRNYYNRASAPETEDDEFADERAEILAEAAALKELAVDYMHPEVGVSSSAPELFGRNYYNRASAPEQEEANVAEECAQVLAEAAALKKLSVDYMHPEVGVSHTSPELFGRNYYNRASAPETEDDEYADDRAEALADAAALKKLAVDYMHPEVGVSSASPELFGRNYYNRASSPEQEDANVAEERAQVLAEAAALKKLAVDYTHPEVGVSSTSPELFGRNYFNRASAPETEEDEYADDRAEALADAAALKKLAVDYMHPEVGVSSASPELFGRNYYNRASAPDTDDNADERAEILAEAAALKKLAADYMHPEVGVSLASPELFGRNYYNRASAPEQEDVSVAKERAQVVAEAAALKKLAVDYMHPEVGVSSASPELFGRNYYNRASAPETEDASVAEESARVLADAAALKKLAVDYAHPEAGVTSASPELFGRNYFDRASAPGHTEISSTGSRIGDDMATKQNAPEKQAQRDTNEDESGMHRSSSAAMLFGLDNAVA